MTFREIVQTPGFQTELEVSYLDNGTTITFSDDDIVRIRQYFNASITGSVMQCGEIDLYEKIPDGKAINVTIKVKYDTYNATKTFTYRVKDSVYEADSRIYTHNVCDFLLDWMVAYEPISNITYPTDVGTFFTKLCQTMGYTTSITLANRNMPMEKDIYEGIGMSYRDVLDDICSANGIRVGKSNFEIVKISLGNTPFTIDDDILMNQNITLNEHYGPVNVITLNRVGFDSAYYPDPLPQTIHDYVIQDNQMLNGDDRLDYAPGIYGELQDLEFDTFDLSLVGVGGFEPLEQVTISTDTKTFNGYVFNGETTWENSGCNDSVYTQYPQFAKTEYQYATADKQQDREAKIIVDKLNQELSLEGKTINLTADDIAITSTNFSVDKNGNMTCTSGTFSGDINTSNDITIGNDLYVGQNQTSSSGNKNIWFTQNMCIRRMYMSLGGELLQLICRDSGGNVKSSISMDNMTSHVAISSIDCGQATTNGYNDTWINFNKTFSSAPNVVCTANVSSAGVNQYTINVWGITTTGFYAFQSSGANVNVAFNWIAIQG